MEISSVAVNSVLVLTAATLFYTALSDLKKYTIPNELIFVLVGLFFIYTVLSGRWVGIYWNVGAALGVFLIALYFYSRRMMGGGDVKILTVAFLWVGVDCALPLAILMLVFVIIHAMVGKLGWIEVKRADGHMRIPFAPSVAAALIGTFMVGCMEGRPTILSYRTSVDTRSQPSRGEMSKVLRNTPERIGPASLFSSFPLDQSGLRNFPNKPNSWS